MTEICRVQLNVSGKLDFIAPKVTTEETDIVLTEDKKYGLFKPRNGVDFTFKVLNEDEEISIKQVEKSIMYAVRRWMISTPIKIRRARKLEIPDFRIEFRTVKDDVDKQLTSNTLMYHYFPISGLDSPFRGLCVVNKAFRWTTNGKSIPMKDIDPTYKYPNSRMTTYDFDQVYTHEVGHGLGLPHAKEGGHIMSSNAGIMSEYLSELDVVRIQAKYGKSTLSEKHANRWLDWLKQASER